MNARIEPMSETTALATFAPARPSERGCASTASANRAATLLRRTATTWLLCAIAGQLLFAAYVAGFYGSAALRGEPETWNRVLPHGYVAGEGLLNAVLGVHLAFAVAIVVAGAAQLTPGLRRRAPGLHRWTGRGYLVAAALTSIGGVVMVWTRGTAGDRSQHLAISANAIVIVACAVAAWRHARAGRLEAHRRWALRTFLAVSGVWFFRVGLMAWIVLNQGPRGFDPVTFTGPFLTVLSFAQFVLPLAMLEMVLRAQRGGDARAALGVALLLGLSTLLTAVGIAAAVALMWLPPLLHA